MMRFVSALNGRFWKRYKRLPVILRAAIALHFVFFTLLIVAWGTVEYGRCDIVHSLGKPYSQYSEKDLEELQARLFLADCYWDKKNGLLLLFQDGGENCNLLVEWSLARRDVVAWGHDRTQLRMYRMLREAMDEALKRTQPLNITITGPGQSVPR